MYTVCFNYSVFSVYWKAHTACDLNFIVKVEGLTQGHRQSHTLKKW